MGASSRGSGFGGVAALLIATLTAALLLVSPPQPAAAATTTRTFTNTVSKSGTSWRVHKFSVTAKGRIDASLGWGTASANLNLGLRNPAGTWVAWASTTNRPETLSYNAGATGEWAIGVRAVSGSSSYTAKVTHQVPDTTTSPTSSPTWSHQVGGPGRAEMYPSGVDVARSSRGAPAGQVDWVFVADTGNDRVAAYDAGGALRWQAGRRGRSLGQYAEPRDVAYLNGKLYVADTGNNRVQVLDAATGQAQSAWPTFFGAIMGITAGKDSAGRWRVIAADAKNSRMSIHAPDDSSRVYVGTYGKGDGQLNEPRDGAFDKAGNLYVADLRNQRIAIFNANLGWRGSFGSLGSGPGQFRGPYGIEIDDADAVYVADSNNQRLQKLTTAGAWVRSWGTEGSGTGQTRQLRNVAVGGGSSPDVYAADLWGYKIEQWFHGGAHKRKIAGTAPPAGGFNKPHGLALDGARVHVADTVHHRVQRFGTTAFEGSWGDRGWGAQLAGLNWPRGLSVDAARSRLWVADTKNWRVSEFALDGTPTGVTYGSLGSGAGQLNWPSAVAAVPCGPSGTCGTAGGAGVIIADTYNHRIVSWDPDTGTRWTATGFNFPKDLTIAAGTVYVADSLNRRVVKLRLSDGAVTGTISGTQIHRIEGIAVASDGDLWVADTSHNRLLEIAPSGAVKQVYGSAGSGHGQFDEPTHVQIRAGAGGDLLYVVDTNNDRIEVFDIR